MDDLYKKSVALIKQYQHETGSYVACPNFKNYLFSWLRDGSFIAYAMDLSGEHESASKFHCWVNTVISRYGHKVGRVEQALKNMTPLDDKDFLFTRYTLDGFENHQDDGWGNFQYDGYGTWLWALKEHIEISNDSSLIAQFQDQILVVVRYLTLVWKLPSYDCWEEHPELLHPYTIAAAYGGLKAVLELAEIGLKNVDIDLVNHTLAEMKDYVVTYAVGEEGFLKHISPNSEENPLLSSGVDSSLLGLGVPYGIFDLEDAVMKQTILAIRKNLQTPSGGIYRYREDTYYGGSAWILLTAWLGWFESLSGDNQLARERLEWIQNQADGQGWLPEQVNEYLLAPDYLDQWKGLWGPSATPLLWSHAMYIILYKSLQNN